LERLQDVAVERAEREPRVEREPGLGQARAPDLVALADELVRVAASRDVLTAPGGLLTGLAPAVATPVPANANAVMMLTAPTAR
jgi:hypothetical protein